ncbi:MAG: hypothetical protein ACRCVU_01770, partial [Flavobacterium sp.]
MYLLGWIHLYEGGFSWEFVEENLDFNKTLESINEITQRYNCLRALLYPNDEDFKNYNDSLQDKYNFINFEEAQKQVIEEEYKINDSIDNFKIQLKEYSFFELPKIKGLSTLSIDTLITEIHSSKIGVKITWFYYLDFIVFFDRNLSKTKTERNIKLAKLLNTNK